MRRLLRLCYLSCCAAGLAGCARPDTEKAADTAAGDTTAPAAAAASPAALSLSAVAGRWNVRSVPESGPDTTTTTYVLNATADTTGWTRTHPNRQPIPVRVVAVAGDSAVIEAGPFESQRRRGVQVRTRTVLRLQGDRLVGSAVARYATTGPDSVGRFRAEGTRAP